MPAFPYLRLQLMVFALVSAAFTNIYLAQPVLPMVQAQFGIDIAGVSWAVSAVILGMALANLPFGLLVDRWPIQPIILVGGLMMAGAGLVCALTDSFPVLIAARFVQGLFIPALTTSIAAYLGKTLPIEKLSVVMGSYVAATVLGGLGGRLMGGWLFPADDWRYAFMATAILTVLTTVIAVVGLPKPSNAGPHVKSTLSYGQLLAQWPLVRYFICAAGSFAVFSSVFNYLPFRLADAPFGWSTEATTTLYLVYIMGIFMAPLAGRWSVRFGSRATLVAGSLVLLLALLLLQLASLIAVIVGLTAVCAGFFCVHAAAVGALNRSLTSGHGRANALYVLFYYVGGWLGISLNGLLYQHWGWTGVIGLSLLLVLIPLTVGLTERRHPA